MKENKFFEVPILFMIFNRPESEKKVFEQIRKMRPKYLYVAADGPRNNRKDDIENCKLAKDIIDKGVDWDCKVKKLYRKNNFGCKLAVSSAIDWFFENVEEGIILEDDCLPNLSFFKYCEVLLNKYRNEERVMHITGGCYIEEKIKKENYNKSYYFSKNVHVWGWATWRRAWKNYDISMKKWNKNQESKYLSNMFEDYYYKNVWKNIDKINTWDYQWLNSVVVNNGLAIISSVNLIKNIGLKEGTHVGSGNNVHNQDVAGKMYFPLVFPKKIVWNKNFDKYFFYKYLFGPKIFLLTFIDKLRKNEQ